MVGTALFPASLIHILAALLFVVLPVTSRLRYARLNRRLESGDPLARIRAYQSSVFRGALLLSVICLLPRVAGLSAAQLGFSAPRSWSLTLLLSLGVMVFFLVSALRIRSRAAAFREKLQGRAGAMLPSSLPELRWFGILSVVGGLFEEAGYRGFLFYYIRLWLPQINVVALVLIASLVFGLGHLYQGWKGIAATSAAGLILSSVYAATGSLFAPAVIHIFGNMRAVLIFWPGASPTTESPGVPAA